jgi:PadR family transcriptional regulator, regulatory protein AphA
MPGRRTTTANALLGLLALRPSWPVYELTKQLRRNMRFFWPRAESRIYDEAKALVDHGLATAETATVGGRRRTTYAITDAGRETLLAWLSTPPRGTALACEPLLRVFLLDLGGHEQVHRALDQLEADAHAILDVGRVVGAEYLAGTAPFQDQVHVRAFVFDFLTNHALMLLEWSRRTRAALDAWPAMSADARAAAAQETIGGLLAAYPPPPPRVDEGAPNHVDSA